MTLSVLYVDDEEDLREIACMALTLDPQIEVRTAASGAQAIEILKAWTPDIILLDMMMPGMDGSATHAAIRQLGGSQPPVVYITARAETFERDRLCADGVLGIIAKPFDPLRLASRVRDFANHV